MCLSILAADLGVDIILEIAVYFSSANFHSSSTTLECLAIILAEVAHVYGERR